MKSVYLAGPIAGLSYGGATDWRHGAESILYHEGIQAVSPMRGKKMLSLERELTSEHYDKHGAMYSQKGITTRDRFDVRTADMVIMNLLGAKKVSIGTMIEAGWADAFRVPIVLVIEPENLHHHTILREIAGFVVETLDEALDIVKVTLS